LDAYTEARDQLHQALTRLIPGRQILLFGSLTQPGTFHDRSDIDLALPEAAADIDPLWLAGELTEALHRPVDVVRLSQCRFGSKIEEQGELWMP
jgi:predicted nucleotidyltransferase